MFAAPDRFLEKSTGEQKMLLNFFIQYPVGRLHVCLYVVCPYGSSDWQTMGLVMALAVVGDDYSRIVGNDHNVFSDS